MVSQSIRISGKKVIQSINERKQVFKKDIRTQKGQKSSLKNWFLHICFGYFWLQLWWCDSYVSFANPLIHIGFISFLKTKGNWLYPLFYLRIAIDRIFLVLFDWIFFRIWTQRTVCAACETQPHYISSPQSDLWERLWHCSYCRNWAVCEPMDCCLFLFFFYFGLEKYWKGKCKLCSLLSPRRVRGVTWRSVVLFSMQQWQKPDGWRNDAWWWKFATVTSEPKKK